MTAFIHRLCLTAFAAVLVTSGAEARMGDSGFATSGIERISVAAWEAAEMRAADAERADEVRAVECTLHDGMRWAIRETRDMAVAAAAEGQNLIGEMGRTFVASAIASQQFAAAAIAEAGDASDRNIIQTARDIAVEGRRLAVEARLALADAVAERRRMFAGAASGPTLVRRAAVELRRFATRVDHVFAGMVAESRLAGARDAAMTAGTAFRGGRSTALHLMTAPRQVVKTSLRADVENAIGAVITAHFAAVPKATPEAAPAIRVWKLSRKSVSPAAALTGGAASGLAQPAVLAAHDQGGDALDVRVDAALSAVQQVGAWLFSVR